MLFRVIDTMSELTGKLAAWMFFAVGLFVTFEVVMRYVFTMPTIWVDEVSRIFQIWATYLAAAYVLKHRELVVIEVAFKDSETLWRKLVESFAIVVIALFCVVACWYGFDQWLKATLKGHTTDSFLAPPKWLTHASIWVGFGLLLLQCCVEMVRLWTVGVPKSDEPHGAH